MKMTLLFKVKHGVLTVKERRVIVTVWVLMRVIGVTLNFHHHQLKEGAVPEGDGVPQVLLTDSLLRRGSRWYPIKGEGHSRNRIFFVLTNK